jgi:hypothetical protein
MDLLYHHQPPDLYPQGADFLSWGVTHPANPNPHPQLRLVDIDRVVDGGTEDPFGNVVSNGSFSKLHPN